MSNEEFLFNYKIWYSLIYHSIQGYVKQKKKKKKKIELAKCSSRFFRKMLQKMNILTNPVHVLTLLLLVKNHVHLKQHLYL